ncbi:unnamed protein product [Phytophthora fragariaefolia]|uniref:Unnamed protein product n=1 Tax=Phytophthora fragariaefolia TaxID=1490495 RepID=A0A9W6XG82_9STRA|nr:unnamed protein product [Phytophthora fragariaefolia]
MVSSPSFHICTASLLTLMAWPGPQRSARWATLGSLLQSSLSCPVENIGDARDPVSHDRQPHDGQQDREKGGRSIKFPHEARTQAAERAGPRVGSVIGNHEAQHDGAYGDQRSRCDESMNEQHNMMYMKVAVLTMQRIHPKIMSKGTRNYLKEGAHASAWQLQGTSKLLVNYSSAWDSQQSCLQRFEEEFANY